MSEFFLHQISFSFFLSTILVLELVIHRSADLFVYPKRFLQQSVDVNAVPALAGANFNMVWFDGKMAEKCSKED